MLPMVYHGCHVLSEYPSQIRPRKIFRYKVLSLMLHDEKTCEPTYPETKKLHDFLIFGKTKGLERPTYNYAAICNIKCV